MQTVDRNILVITGFLRENRVTGFRTKPCLKRVYLLEKLFFLEIFVRQHAELKVEKIFSKFVFILFRLVNFGPNVSDIHFDLLHDPFKVVASIVEISEHK